MQDQIAAGLSEATGASTEDVAQKIVGEMILLKRPSVPEDVAKTVSFLASEDAEVSFVLACFEPPRNEPAMAADSWNTVLILSNIYSTLLAKPSCAMAASALPEQGRELRRGRGRSSILRSSWSGSTTGSSTFGFKVYSFLCNYTCLMSAAAA